MLIADPIEVKIKNLVAGSKCGANTPGLRLLCTVIQCGEWRRGVLIWLNGVRVGRMNYPEDHKGTDNSRKAVATAGN